MAGLAAAWANGFSMLKLGSSNDQDNFAEIYNLEIILFSQSYERIVFELRKSRRLTRLLSLIEGEYSETSLDLRFAAERCGVEKNHLNYLLRRATGLTFHKLLVRYRLLQASRMLLSSNRSILEIAGWCGFGSLRTFERNFSRAFGSSPGRYREEVRIASRRWWKASVLN